MKSFLVCIRDNLAEIYIDGLPVGIIINGVFSIHQNKLADGSKYNIDLDADLIKDVGEVIDLIKKEIVVAE